MNKKKLAAQAVAFTAVLLSVFYAAIYITAWVVSA